MRTVCRISRPKIDSIYARRSDEMWLLHSVPEDPFSLLSRVLFLSSLFSVSIYIFIGNLFPAKLTNQRPAFTRASRALKINQSQLLIYKSGDNRSNFSATVNGMSGDGAGHFRVTFVRLFLDPLSRVIQPGGLYIGGV